jgi:hypothetical protein
MMFEIWRRPPGIDSRLVARPFWGTDAEADAEVKRLERKGYLAFYYRRYGSYGLHRPYTGGRLAKDSL